MTDTLDKAYLTLRSLAQYSDLSRRTLQTYVKRPHDPLPCYKVQGRILVKRTEFDAWLRRFKVERPARLDAVADELLEAMR